MPPELFAAPKRLDLIHRVVCWFRAGERAGLASTKGRGEVAGSNRKIHPQKGTGRARAGDARAPHRRGGKDGIGNGTLGRSVLLILLIVGGVCFGPKPRDFSFKLPLKIRWLAFRSALTAKYEAGQLSVIDSETLNLPTHKTGQLARLLDGFVRPDKSARPRKLLILGTQPASASELVNLQRAAQSLDGAEIKYIQVQADLRKRNKLKQHQLHPVTAYHLIRSHHVCITPQAVSFYKSINDSIYHQ